VNIWISAMITLFRPQIEHLLRQRDKAISSWALAHPGVDVFEDRALELTAYLEINVEEQINAVKRALS
jgi:molybdopterin-guanine dinucleotide biosynthesis protein A